jgi:hypothetical protein
MTGARSWGFGDAWLLLAVQMTGSEASHPLRYVIGTADYINHAIPSKLEVSTSVGRLSAAGLLAVDGEELAVTPKASALFFAAREGGSMHDALDRLRSDLKQLPVPSASTGARLPPDAYDRALRAYYDSTSTGRSLAPPKVSDYSVAEWLQYAAKAYREYIRINFEWSEPDLVMAVGCLESTSRCLHHAHAALAAQQAGPRQA